MSPINLVWSFEQGRWQESFFGTLKMLCGVSFTILQARVGLEGVSLRGLKAPHCARSPVTIALGY